MSTLLLPVLFPIAAGILILVTPGKVFAFGRPIWERKGLCIITGGLFVVTALLVLNALLTTTPRDMPQIAFFLTRKLPIQFGFDALGRVFAVMISIVMLLAGFFSFVYMKHEQREKRYYGFYLIVYGMLNGLCFADNLMTFYLFYELMTITSVPLVLHSQTKEAIFAGLKYLFYSFCGAYMVLFGLFCLSRYCLSNTLTFGAGGILDKTLTEGHETLLLVTAFLMILGFGVKAGMFPLHAWLTKAHPAAPAPVSAVLSGIVVKAGVLGIIRVVYYLFGTQFLAGTWVQYTWLILTLVTIVMGSMMAYWEKGLKKRLAYSTISQVSYILFGLALMQPTAFTGAILHTVFHAFMKAALFLAAGAMIYQTGKKNVSEFSGIGKEMPIVMWCYTIASLGLIGIPPASGFISKWYLALGSLDFGARAFAYIGVIVLLVSALLTAGYLLPVTIRGFFVGEDYDYGALKKKEPSKLMTVPLILLAALTLLLGMFPGGLISYIGEIAANIIR
ncbi:MAG: proton-conducting membrane transporter [Clostridium sp.]|nr:proton-conducting membrane transporter [Clostridium sp.]